MTIRSVLCAGILASALCAANAQATLASTSGATSEAGALPAATLASIGFASYDMETAGEDGGGQTAARRASDTNMPDPASLAVLGTAMIGLGVFSRSSRLQAAAGTPRRRRR